MQESRFSNECKILKLKMQSVCMWCLVRATSDQTLAAPSPDVYQIVHKKKQIVLKCSVSATHLHLHRINASVI